jgi:GMP synthase (glutamine-hydrolysing)
MRIGILHTWRTPKELRNKHGDYDDMFRRFLAGRGFEFVNYPALDGLIPKSVRDADG